MRLTVSQEIEWREFCQQADWGSDGGKELLRALGILKRTDIERLSSGDIANLLGSKAQTRLGQAIAQVLLWASGHLSAADVSEIRSKGSRQ
jgi:hypothetical protein